MDLELYRLIRLNEKKRQYYDGWNINLEEFSVFDIMEDKLDPIDTEPIESSREPIPDSR